MGTIAQWQNIGLEYMGPKVQSLVQQVKFKGLERWLRR